MINIKTEKSNAYYSAIRRVNYEILVAIAAGEDPAIVSNFQYLEPDTTSTLKETEKRKGEAVQMFLNASFSGTLLAGLTQYGPCDLDIPLCGGDFSDWTSGSGPQSHAS